MLDIKGLCREVHPKVVGWSKLEILVQSGEWFSIKPSRAGSLTLNHFSYSIKPFGGDSLMLNHRVRAPCPPVRYILSRPQLIITRHQPLYDLIVSLDFNGLR